MKRFVVAFLLCLSFACTIHAQTQSFWTTSTVPTNTTGNDSSSVELGLRFSSNVAGNVTGARVYCAKNSSGTHTVHLWNSTGTSLATVTLPACSGWTAVNFASPIAVTAGSTYTLSYHTIEYPWNTSFFTSTITSGNLTAPVNAGVYNYGSSPAYPSSTYQASNYWVDVLFAPGTTPPPPTYTISGTFTGVGSATVKLSGAATATTTSTTGSYSFTGLANGTYAVTPSSSGYSFNPTTQSVTINGGNATVLVFNATAVPTYTISGTFTGVGSATLTLSGAATMTTTSTTGTYSFTGLANGSYAVTPSSTGYSFNPTAQSVTINGGNATVPVFTATAVPTYTISGTVSPASVGSGAIVTLSGPFGATTSVNSGGTYSFSGMANGTYTVTPTSSTATFTPTVQNVTVSNGNATVPVFAATASSGIIFYDDFTGTTLSSAWTAIARHGEYAQDETECNVPKRVSVSGGFLTITTLTAAQDAALPDGSSQDATCGDFNVPASPGAQPTVRHKPSSWPYVTGDAQWTNLNFTYGTIEIRAKFPSSATKLWPATWLLGSNCQVTNIYTADTGYSTCPDLGVSGYTEIDMTECYVGGGWCQFHVADPSFGIGNGCDASYNVDTNYHVFTTTWTSTSIKQYMDGALITTCNKHLGNPMFLIIQTQTGGAGGTPSNGNLPAQFVIDYVKVTQP